MSARTVKFILPPEKLHLVHELLAEYQQQPWTRAGDYRAFARQNSAIPSFENGTSVTFLKTDGSFINLDTENSPGAVTAENDVRWQLGAHVCAEYNPRIRALLPPRPPGAETCTFCSGTG